jgi:uridine phosphorylase
MRQLYPILEFDPNSETALDPHKVFSPLPDMPERVVLCFFQEVLQLLHHHKKTHIIHHLGSEIGDNPIYVLEHNGQKVALMHPGVGGSLAGGFLEELIACGGRKFMACGGAGVIVDTIDMGAVIIPSSAVRDEGTSYHYLPPSREVEMQPEIIKVIEQTLEKRDIPYQLGKTWTTDGLYRETREKVLLRREEGCITVEMEVASFLAIAQFRSVQFGQILYGGDDVSGELWDSRGWSREASVREKLFWLSVETVLNF